MSGKLDKILTNGSIQKAATVPSNVTYASMNVLVVNPLSTVTQVELWLSDATSPSPVDYIQSSVAVPAGGTLEVYARLVSPGENLFVRAAAGLAVRVETADEVLPA